MADKTIKIKTLTPHVGAYENKAGTTLEVTEEMAEKLIEKGYAEKVTAPAPKKKNIKEGE
jgi:hypothetical protein